jgi:hypothetical protein
VASAICANPPRIERVREGHLDRRAARLGQHRHRVRLARDGLGHELDRPRIEHALVEVDDDRTELTRDQVCEHVVAHEGGVHRVDRVDGSVVRERDARPRQEPRDVAAHLPPLRLS